MKCYTYIQETIKKNLKVMELKSDNLKMFINTLWYDNVDDYDFLKLKNVLPLTIYFQRLHVFLIV
jgi:hypothetical protein